ncbi:hypothetical protein RIB2604_03601050 [Aspergillus luchuensis]|uniref:Ubiquitin-related modifier 1 n=1 Tax=Aspergillus kawachii TaxID=1069201 RepID=A0A146FYM9_ASPKA|nr:hypothetical protein RIB2604_03601050 [Aspergillus luchuensis]
MATNPEAPELGKDGAGSIAITVEFTGGLEILFANERKHHVTLPSHLDDGSRPTISYLLGHLVKNYMKDQRQELFILEGNVYVPSHPMGIQCNAIRLTLCARRPGILVLINDADWELEGEENYELQQKDNIVFVSTLHGG